MNKTAPGFFFFLLIFWIIIGIMSLPGASAPLTEEDMVIQAVEKVRPGVVNISTRGTGGQNGGGSGVIIRSDGFVLTNAHVIRGARTILVRLQDGRKFYARSARAASERDLAVIRLSAAGLPVPRFGNSDTLRPGQTAIAIGNPMKFSWSVSRGCISATGRDIPLQGVLYRDLIQTDAAINPGSSGGALANSRGEVIGISTLVYTGTRQYSHAVGLNFAIPINTALAAAKLLMNDTVKTTSKPWLGLFGKTITRETAELYDLPVKSGVIVESVVPYGPAADAGIAPSDIITGANNRKVAAVEDLKACLEGLRAGSVIQLEIWHREKKSKIPVTVQFLSQ